MRVLLLTDTHGKIDIIDQLADRCHADACIHCGDIGLFDSVSIRNMPAGELKKIIRHASSLTEDEKARYSSLPQAELAELVLQRKLAGNFEEYLTGKKTFSVPVYAVWGNHEEGRIVSRLRSEPLKNLTLLDENDSVLLEGVRLYGLGGNFNEKHFLLPPQQGLSGRQLKSTLQQYADLAEMLDSFPADETRIQITHCDPAEVPFLEALACRCGASLTFSGHMHRKETRRTASFCGNGDDVFRSGAKKYPSALWEKLLKRSWPAQAMEHFNLTPAQPLVAEIAGTIFQIQ